MTYSENSEFIKDIQEVLKKHNLMLMYSNNPTKLVTGTNHLEGFHFFFTKGEKKIYLRGGEGIEYPSSLTIKMLKARYSEDDGN